MNLGSPSVKAGRCVGSACGFAVGDAAEDGAREPWPPPPALADEDCDELAVEDLRAAPRAFGSAGSMPSLDNVPPAFFFSYCLKGGGGAVRENDAAGTCARKLDAEDAPALRCSDAAGLRC